MVAQAIIALLVWLHVFSVTGWLGSNLMVELMIVPMIPRFSPPTRGELMAKLFPKISLFAQIFGGMTILFGLLLAIAVSNGDFSIFSLGNQFGLRIDIGAIFGLLAVIVGGGIAGVTGRRLAVIGRQAAGNPQPAQVAEIAKLEKRLRWAGLFTLVLQGFALTFMIAAATGV